jgi:hypothetical protein
MSEITRTTRRYVQNGSEFIETTIDFAGGFFFYNNRVYGRIFISTMVVKAEGMDVVFNETSGLGLLPNEEGAELLEKSTGSYGLEIIEKYTSAVIFENPRKFHKQTVKRILRDYRRMQDFIRKCETEIV